jgi:hypothetical protein
MPSVVYEIDSFADAVIILTNPCRNFATWDETQELLIGDNARWEDKQTIRAHSSEDDVVPKKFKNKKGKKLGKKSSAKASHTVTSEHDNTRAEPFDGDLTDSLGSFQGSAEVAKPVSGRNESEHEEIHYLVSSRHLMLDSPWFRRTLTAQASAEAVKDPLDERYHIQASEWDEEALLHLLNILHTRSRQIPPTVSLEMLAKIAVLVDYYDLVGAEVMERDVTGWIDHVRRTAIPSSYCRDLMLWICIWRVFQMSKEFEQATAVAIKASRGWLQTLDLPIPESVTCTLSTFPDWN